MNADFADRQRSAKSEESGKSAKVAGRYDLVIGLEVHAQLRTASKLFCSCPNAFGHDPNRNVCPVCLGHPGALPVLNTRAVDLAVLLGEALGCEIRETSVFARKNYFYPDLPKGYQISQFEHPICVGGAVPLGDGRSVGLVRIHIEEDAGKSKHPEAGDDTESRIDLNRCGVPLVEIVGQPELHSAEDAGLYLSSLKRIVEFLDVCDGNMEEGSLRCDANVSLKPAGAAELGTRTEIKNLNSIRNLERAIRFEADRQAKILDDGGTIDQETRLFDEASGRTRSMRGKEDAHDYRYFPDPDLPPVFVSDDRRTRIAAVMPELPLQRQSRFENSFGLSPDDAAVLTQTRALADYYDAVAESAPDPVAAANWVRTELLGRLSAEGKDITSSPVSPRELTALLKALDDGTLSGKLGKAAVAEMVETGDAFAVVVERNGWKVVSDTGQLAVWVAEAIEKNPSEVASYRAGKTSLLNFFVGQVMKASRGQADPGALRPVIEKALED